MIHRADDESIDIELASVVVLAFANLVEENDTIMGFRGTGWHTHGNLILLTGDATYVEVDELELLRRIAAGDVLIVTRYLSGKLDDRWLSHKLEPLDIKYIDTGEELRVQRMVRRSDGRSDAYLDDGHSTPEPKRR